jgi:protein-tyrosine-phosphatase
MLGKNKRSGITVSSAALIDMRGSPPDPKAALLLDEKGFDGDGHKSRLLTEEMAGESDMILVMERRQKGLIIEKYPDAGKKTFLLKSFSTGCNPESDGMNDIDDPYKKSSYHYRLCFSEIFMAIEGLMKCI